MELDLAIPGDGGGAASDTPSAPGGAPDAVISAPAAPLESVPESAPAAQPLAPAEPTPEGTAPAAAQPAAEPTDDSNKAPELTEEDVEKFVKDPNTPKEWRDRLNGAWKLVGQRKNEVQTLQSEFETFKSQYEGKEIPPAEELDRLRQAEETWLGLTSFTAKPEDILGKIKEANPRVYGQLLTKAAWDALETPDGQPDLDNLQAVIDRFSDSYGSTKVQAKDVLQAIQAMASGKINPSDLQMFQTPEEIERWERDREREQETNRTNEQAKANRDFSEKQTRSMFLQQERARISQTFREPVMKVLDTFKLMPAQGEPKVSADFKQGLLQEIGLFVTQASAQNPQLGEADSILQKLSEAAGLDAPAIQSELQSVLSSPGYTLRLNKGLSEIQGKIEKFINQKALQYKYMMMGYEQEVSKNPRPIANAGAAQLGGTPTDGLTEQQLSQMSAAQRADYEAKRLTAEIRALRQPA
jgi:hypothetical protein